MSHNIRQIFLRRWKNKMTIKQPSGKHIEQSDVVNPAPQGLIEYLSFLATL